MPMKSTKRPSGKRPASKKVVALDSRRKTPRKPAEKSPVRDGAAPGHAHTPSDKPKVPDDAGRTFPPVKFKPGAMEGLQAQFDQGDFSGDTQSQKRCEFQTMVEGSPMQCPHVAVISKEGVFHCPTCDRDKKKHLLRLCLLHAPNVWVDGMIPSVQTELDLR